MSVDATEHVSPTSPAALPSPAELPALRLLPVPTSEPPYDDELDLHLPARPAGTAPTALRARVPLRLVADEDDADDPCDRPGPVAGPVIDLAGDLPPVRPAAHALVQGLLEVLAGVRPVSQLRRATSAELFESLELRVHAQPRAVGRRPLTGAVRSLHVQERAAVAEVCARVDRDGRSAALALRLEGGDGRWRCTELTGL